MSNGFLGAAVAGVAWMLFLAGYGFGRIGAIDDCKDLGVVKVSGIPYECRLTPMKAKP